MITDCAVYQDGHRRAGHLPLTEAKEAAEVEASFVWLGLKEPTESEFEAIEREFSLPPLAVEDALKPHQRPKLERYGDILFVVLRTARYVDSVEVIDVGQIMVFIGEQFVITVRHGSATALDGVRKDLESRPEFLRHGPAAVLHGVLDKAVDDYLPALEGLDQDVAQIELDVFGEMDPKPVERIYKLKREVLAFHRAVGPLVEPLDRLVRGTMPHVGDSVRNYFRDVQDHLLRVSEQVDDINNLLSSMLDASLAQVAERQNEDMRKISAWVAIAAVPTMIAGIYGMKVQHMPELTWTFGYPLAIGAMVAICLFLYRKFKGAGWLRRAICLPCSAAGRLRPCAPPGSCRSCRSCRSWPSPPPGSRSTAGPSTSPTSPPASPPAVSTRCASARTSSTCSATTGTTRSTPASPGRSRGPSWWPTSGPDALSRARCRPARGPRRRAGTRSASGAARAGRPGSRGRPARRP